MQNYKIFWPILHDGQLGHKFLWNFFALVIEEFKLHNNCPCNKDAFYFFIKLLGITNDKNKDQETLIKEAQDAFFKLKNPSLFFSLLHDHVNIKLGKKRFFLQNVK